MARDDPARLPERFEERRGTVDSSIAYLEELASNYARLTPRLDRTPCDVNAVARQVVLDARFTGRAHLRLELSARDAIVLSDAVVLRRILENLVENALDSLESAEGTVSLSTELLGPEAGRPTVRVTVSDTGVGMSEEARRHAFDDFYTTKAGGTGLGLSIVRRLVMDLDGSVRVQSELGQGSRFVVELPAHTTQAGGGQS